MSESTTRTTMNEDHENETPMQANEPSYSRFTQQELPACRPLLTPKKVITMFCTIGIIFVPIGAICLAESRKVVEVSKQYDEVCMPDHNTNAKRRDAMYEIEGGVGTSCQVELTIPKDMKPPIYMYYQLTNFYQNHRRYVKSRSDGQLRGDTNGLTDDVMDDCKPQLYADGAEGEEQAIIKPCGLMAWSYFNDTYSMSVGDKARDINEKGIAWKSDKEFKFSDTVGPENFQTDPDTRGGGTLTGALNSDEHFIVWMRTAALPTFRKLWGIIEGDTIEAGSKVTIDISNRYNTYAFDGTKTVILSTTTWLGGRNDFMGIAYLAVGCLCLLCGIFFSVVHMKKPRVLGDITLLSWNK